MVGNVVRNEVAVYHHLAQPGLKSQSKQGRQHGYEPKRMAAKELQARNRGEQHGNSQEYSKQAVDELNPGMQGVKCAIVVAGVLLP